MKGYLVTRPLTEAVLCGSLEDACSDIESSLPIELSAGTFLRGDASPSSQSVHTEEGIVQKR